MTYEITGYMKIGDKLVKASSWYGDSVFQAAREFYLLFREGCRDFNLEIYFRS